MKTIIAAVLVLGFAHWLQGCTTLSVERTHACNAETNTCVAECDIQINSLLKASDRVGLAINESCSVRAEADNTESKTEVIEKLLLPVP